MTNKEKFIDDYVKYAGKMLDIEDEEKLKEIRRLAEERYVDSNIHVYNSNNFVDKYINSADFWYGQNNFILNENGVLTDTTKRNESVTAGLIAQNIEIRQVFKKAKKKAGEVNDTINEKKYATFEALTKLMINGFYGLMIGPKIE